MLLGATGESWCLIELLIDDSQLGMMVVAVTIFLRARSSADSSAGAPSKLRIWYSSCLLKRHGRVSETITRLTKQSVLRERLPERFEIDSEVLQNCIWVLVPIESIPQQSELACTFLLYAAAFTVGFVADSLLPYPA